MIVKNGPEVRLGFTVVPITTILEAMAGGEPAARYDGGGCAPGRNMGDISAASGGAPRPPFGRNDGFERICLMKVS
jgi:hypothetical protein